MTWLSAEQTRAARYCVAEVVRRRRLTGVPLPEWLRALDGHLSMSASGPEPPPRQQQSEAMDTTTSAAAQILGCSTRHVRRIAADLEGRRIAGRWLFHRATVIDYAEQKREHP